MKKLEAKMSRLERKHIKSMGVKTKADLERLFEFQRSARIAQKTNGLNLEPCFVCKSLALKLGYKVK